MVGAGHGVRTDIAAEVDIPLPQGVEDSSLYRADISNRSVRIDLKAVNDKDSDGTGRHGDDDEVDVCRHGRVESAGTQPSGHPRVTDLVITQMNGVPRRRERAPHRGTDESGANDHDVAVPTPLSIGGRSVLIHVLSAGWGSSASRAASRSPLMRRNLRGIALFRSSTATSKASTPSARGAALGPLSEARARTASLAASARPRPGRNPPLTTSAMTSADPPMTAKFASSATEPS